MSYQVLYRTYRPKRFEEVVGQEYIIKTLKNAIKVNKIAHAYLFAGPRGTGKTTIAKLFAKAINCEDFKEESCDQCKNCQGFNSGNNPDIIELDAASNNGVDKIREIVEQVNYAPVLGKYKVYIIDEVHMLSSSAFNALLKTLEEPPAHVVFILATTDPQKIIPTVLSRCQRYNFSKIANYNIKKRIKEILNKENIKYEEEALDEVAVLAEGGLRDALSLLEQVLSYNSQGIYLDDIQKIFGLSSNSEKIGLLRNIHTRNITESIASLRKMNQAGIDMKRLATDLLEIIKETVIYSDDARADLLSKIKAVDAQQLLEIISVRQLLNDMRQLEDLLIKVPLSQNFINYFELCLIKMGELKEVENISRKPVEVKTEVSEEKAEEVKEEVKEEVVEETPQVIEETAEEEIQPVKEEKNDEDTVDIEYLATLLLTASKQQKINDALIYNRLSLFENDEDKRKFYNLLNNTELFASGNDAIIIVAEKYQARNINSKENKFALYNFLNEEFGIDKVIYAIEEIEKTKLIATYKMLRANHSAPGVVEKPVIQKEETKEEKLLNMFGDKIRFE